MATAYWLPDVLYMHLVSDIAIALAYFSIPLSILYLLRKRKQPLPHRWVFVFFAVFIFLCGAGHMIALVTLWYPIYYIEGYRKGGDRGCIAGDSAADLPADSGADRAPARTP